MVTMRRKINQEKDRFGSFDSVIEIDEVKGKSYNVNQNEIAQTVNYSTRAQAMMGGNTKKKSSEIMPQIKNEVKTKERVVESIGFKTKMLLSVYVAVAVILAAVVIATGVAITNASNTANQLQNVYNKQLQVASVQHDELVVLSDEYAQMGYAGDVLDMVKIENYIQIPVVDINEPVTYEPRTSIFDKICRFISSIFS